MTEWHFLGKGESSIWKSKEKQNKTRICFLSFAHLLATSFEITCRRDSCIIYFDKSCFLIKMAKFIHKVKAAQWAGKGIYLDGFAKELYFLLLFLFVCLLILNYIEHLFASEIYLTLSSFHIPWTFPLCLSASAPEVSPTLSAVWCQ